MQQQRSKTPSIPPQTGFMKILHSLIIISLFLMIGSIIPVLVLTIVSGLAMYQPAQLHWLLSLFINWQILRTAHFLTVPISLIFGLVHVIMGLRVGGLRLTQSMFRP